MYRKFLGKAFIKGKLSLLASFHILYLRLVFGKLIVAEHERILGADFVGVFHLGSQPSADNVGLGDQPAFANAL